MNFYVIFWVIDSGDTRVRKVGAPNTISGGLTCVDRIWTCLGYTTKEKDYF